MFHVDLQECFGIMCIVEHESGPFYHNQVGGVSCLQRVCQGILIPVFPRLPENPDRLLDATGLSVETVNKWLREQELEANFEARETEEGAHEAWVPVKVKESPASELFKTFAGMNAILTYMNSD